MRTIGLGILAGLILLPSWAGAQQEKVSPPSFEGSWEAPVRYTGAAADAMQTLELKTGRMVWIEPRQPGDKEKRTGFRIEAEYTVSKSGRVYGMVVLAGGSTKADEGDVFSFVPKFEGKNLRMDDIRGSSHIESLADKLSFSRKE